MPVASPVLDVQPALALLVVGSSEQDYDSLADILRVDCLLHRASDRKEAIRLLRSIKPHAVICEEVLADGDWRGLLVDLQREGTTPLIVTSRIANDRLWAEVLNLGAYDLVATPFARDEISRVVKMAARRGEFESR